MAMFLFGWLFGWIVLTVAVGVISALHARRATVERDIRTEIKVANERRATELAAQSAVLLEQIKANPQASTLLKGLEQSSENLVKRTGFTFCYPPGLPPEPFIAVVKAMAMNLERHLQESKAIHDKLGPDRA